MTDKPDKPDKPEKPDKPDKPDKPEKPEKLRKPKKLKEVSTFVDQIRDLPEQAEYRIDYRRGGNEGVAIATDIDVTKGGDRIICTLTDGQQLTLDVARDVKAIDTA